MSTSRLGNLGAPPDAGRRGGDEVADAGGVSRGRKAAAAQVPQEPDGAQQNHQAGGAQQAWQEHRITACLLSA